MVAHILFEQSGTFKKQFNKLGITAYDYDILNDFGCTDFRVNIFEHITKAYANEPSLFDNITKDDIVLAFFPCVRFEAQALLWFRGDSFQIKDKPLDYKLETCLKFHKELSELYEMVTKLTHICYTRGLKLVIENPYTTQHYLTKYWCVQPSLIEKNRKLEGDYFEKPTQFWFINWEPFNNELHDDIDVIEEHTTVDDAKQSLQQFGICNITNTVARSMISPVYANRFIRKHLLPPRDYVESEIAKLEIKRTRKLF